MWDKSEGHVAVQFPRTFNFTTMGPFIARVVDEQRNAKCSSVTFDFQSLEFIEPVGVVILSNLVEYFGKLGVKVRFAFTAAGTAATNYLDDSGFFERYAGKRLREYSKARPTTMPLSRILGDKATEYLYFQLMPWIGNAVDQSAQSLAPLRASLEEIFHNVKDHSGVDIGCAFAQHFPRDRRLQIAVSDFGDGIPEVVRRVRPGVNDGEALRLACQEGFTTQTNVWNRGAGLPNLIRFVTNRNGGTVLIASGSGRLAATLSGGATQLSARSGRDWYPGTLVRVILKTDRLPQLAEDVEQEEFSWS